MLYEYKCEQCQTSYEDFNPVDKRYDSVCPTCGRPAKLKLSFHKNGPTPIIFRPYWDEHITHQPVYIESKKQKKAIVEKNGLIWRE